MSAGGGTAPAADGGWRPAITAARLVAGREITTRARSRAFVVSTAVMILAIAGYTLLMYVVSSSNSSATVGVVPATAPLGTPMTSVGRAVGENITVRTEPDLAAGEAALRAGSLDALLVGTPEDFQVVVKRDIKSKLSDALDVLARQITLDTQIRAAGGDPAAAERALANSHLTVDSLEGSNPDRGQQLALAIVAAVLVYVSLVVYGQSVAQGVIEEKSSRVVELLLSTVRSWQLMIGKVVGIAVVGLLQFLIVAGIGLGVALGTGRLTLPASTTAGAAAWALVWYLLGYFLFAFLFAAAGSLVSRQEDASSVTGPLMVLVIVPFVIGITTLPNNPDSTLVEAMSLIPLFAPMLMPMRIALGGVPAWQPALAVALAVVLFAVLVWLAGRIYSNAVLRTGMRVSLRTALRGD